MLIAADVDGIVVFVSDDKHRDAGGNEEVDSEGVHSINLGPDALPSKKGGEGNTDELEPDRPPEEPIVVRAVTDSVEGAVGAGDGSESKSIEVSLIALGHQLKNKVAC